VAAGIERKLTTIMAADAAGYSRAMAADEVAALGALRDARAVFARLIERHRGRIANTAGDGLIAEFPSVVEAVQCAVEVQRELAPDTVPGPPHAPPLRFRIGLHLGDVMVDGGDLLGEGVNLAARLQALAPPGGILISHTVHDQVRTKLAVGFEHLGAPALKNLDPVAVWRVVLDGPPGPARGQAAPSPPSAPVPAAAAA
jgi:adenylate cyclase